MGRDPTVRKRLAELGRRYLGLAGEGAIQRDAIDPDLAATACVVVGEEADNATFDKLLGTLEQTRDEIARRNIIAALGSARQANVAERSRQLALDERLRPNEVMSPIWSQLSHINTRDSAWRWFEDHLDPIIARLSPRRAGWLPRVTTVHCDVDHAADAEQLFGPHIAKLAGGPRNLALALETTRLCAARLEMQSASLEAYFEGK